MLLQTKNASRELLSFPSLSYFISIFLILTLSFSGPGWDTYDAEVEYKRIGLAPSPVFRLTRMNKDYSLCPSYPCVFAVPANITDEMLAKVASFREKGRVCTHPLPFATPPRAEHYFRYQLLRGYTQMARRLRGARSLVWDSAERVVWKMRCY